MTYMQDLPAGAVFHLLTGGADDRTHYQITTAAIDHPDGWVEVRNLSMSDARAEQLLNTPGAVEKGCDPRDGFFAYSHPTEVEVVS